MSSDDVVMVPVTTPAGTFNVWTRWIGENSRLRVLFLHGGPGVSHEYLLALERPLVEAGVEVWFYDQLGSSLSDQPDDPSLWGDRSLRRRGGAGARHSGLRPQEASVRARRPLLGRNYSPSSYALRYQEKLKALVVSNMMSSAPAYNQYVADVLLPAMAHEARTGWPTSWTTTGSWGRSTTT